MLVFVDEQSFGDFTAGALVLAAWLQFCLWFPDRLSMCMDQEGALRAQKVRDLVFVLAGIPGIDLTWSPLDGVMMICVSTV